MIDYLWLTYLTIISIALICVVRLVGLEFTQYFSVSYIVTGSAILYKPMAMCIIFHKDACMLPLVYTALLVAN